MNKRLVYFLLSFASALLLSLSWFWHLGILIFFAFVPLLLLEDKISNTPNLPKAKLKLLGYAYLTFFSWNILVTWWVVYASLAGASMAFILNSLFMSLVFVVFSNIKRRLNKPWAIWLLIPLWIAWEHWHTLWDLTWTWLTLGNVFAFNHNWVQWYEYTGTSGGTLWILATNILIFQTIKYNATLKLVSRPVVKIAAAIIVPIFISYLIVVLRKPLSQQTGGVNTVVVQPNIDPYNSKFSLDYQTQFLKALNLIRGKVSTETDYLVLPETFITEGLNEASINQSEPIQWFRDSLISKFPNLKVITGADTYVYYQNDKEATSTSRVDEQSGKHYDVFNTALLIDKNNTQVYHKSKLVPGVERMPFPALLKPLESLAINMGGTMGSLGTQETRDVFPGNKNTSVAPVVCYESVYADYITGYIRKGANLIFIITNDGWWEDTPGYIQHVNYARLRAIENRRQLARSANTGISCFIDEFGNISDATGWWQEAVIEKKIYPNDTLTFFSRFGDLISYTSMVLTVLILVFASVMRWLKYPKAVG
jgi:apolipoprotein N-acyltransferase